MPKSTNRSYRFWGSNRKTRSHRFWGQTGRNRRPWFWCQTKKPTLLVSLCMVQAAYSVTWPLDRPATESLTCAWLSLILYTRSPTPAMILIAARHVTPVTCTPRDKQTWFSKRTDRGRVEPPKLPGFQFKPSKSITHHKSNQGTDHLVSQSPLDEYIDNTKAQSLNFESKTHEVQLEDQKPMKSSRRSSRRRKTRKTNKWHEKR
jgi:hypothetical protein